MADITFNCPKCDQELEAPADFAGQTVECPGCGAEIDVPEHAAPDDAADRDEDFDESQSDDEDAEDVAGEDGICPDCGAEMESDAILCMGCGFHRRLGRKIRTDFDEN